MIKKTKFFFHNIFVIIILILLFLGSIYQGSFIYDGFHWGLVASNAYDLLDGKLPYKDFFVHYGFLTVFFHSLSLFFSNNIYSIFVFTAFIYVVSIFILLLIVRKFLNKDYEYIFLFIVCLMQPFIVYPWHTYLVYFFLLLSIFFLLRNDLLSYFLYPFFLQLTFLSSESFKMFSIVALILSIFCLLKKELKYSRLKIFLLIFSGYFTPLLIFFLYLLHYDIFDYWLLHSQIPEIFLNRLDLSKLDLIYNFIKNYLIYSIDIYQRPFIFFGLVINLICVYYIIQYLFKKFNNINLLYISLLTLLANFNLIFRHESFRFFSGSIIGIVILFHLIEKIKDKDIKFICIGTILFLSILSNPFEKNQSNRNYTQSAQKKISYSSDDIKLFKNLKFEKNTWAHLNDLDKKLYEISKNCSQIKYIYNLTSDHFYYLIGKNYFNTFQKIPGNDETILKNYYQSLNKIFDSNLQETLRFKIENSQTLIIRENLLNNKLNLNNTSIELNNYKSIPLKYSYTNKKKKLYVPSSCIL